jgi:uncharacterized protein YbjQ (UPF0145 family)
VIDAMTDASLVESIDLPAESQMTEEEFHLAKSNALEELAQKARDAKAENVHLRQAMYLALGAHYEDQYGLFIGRRKTAIRVDFCGHFWLSPQNA